MHKILFILWIVITVFPLRAEQSEKFSFSVQEAMEFAVQNNPNVENARMDMDAARKLIWENTALGLPQLSASLDYTDNLSLMTTLIPAEFFGGEPGEKIAVRFGTQHNATASINASQLVFNGPYIVGLQAANVYRQLTEQNLEKTEEDTKELVGQTYYLVLMAEETAATLAENLTNLQRSLFETRQMYEAGLLEETDVDQLQVAVTSLENTIRSLNRQVELSRNMLLYQLGLPQETELELTDDLQTIMEAVEFDALLIEELDLENNIEFQLMNTQEKLAYLNMKRIQYEYFPSLSAFYLNNRNALRDEFNFFDFNEKWYESSMIGLSVNIPIFTSGNRSARVAQSRIEWEKAKNNRDFVARGLELEYTQAKYDFSNALEKFMNEKKNIELAQKIVDRTGIKYKEGVVSSLQLTQASDQLLNSQANYVNALVELLNAKMKLDKVLNKL